MRILPLLLAAALTLAPVVAAAQPADNPPPPPAAPEPVTPPPAAPETPPPLPLSPRVLEPPPVVVPLPHVVEPIEKLPIAGYANGNFFLRDPHDWFVIFPKGRLQLDFYSFPARGEPPTGTDNNSSGDKRPKNTIFVRRARAELQGTFMGHFDFHIAGEFASTPATGSTGTVADAYIIVDYLPFLKLQVGQYDIPFTLENRTSDKYFDFMERSLAVRAFGVPTNKDMGAMLFGSLPKHVAYYSLGLFNGDGQSFKNQDNNLAVIGRGFVAPLAWLPRAEKDRWLQDIWVGASFWYQRNTNLGGPAAASTGGGQNDLPGMTTQGGVSFFDTNYNTIKDSSGNNIRAHLLPWGDTVKWAIEANIPIKKIGVRFELIHQSIDLAQYSDSVNATAAALKRGGGQRGASLDGYGYYLELYYWILGDANFLETPGLETAPRIKRFAVAKEPTWGLMVAAKYDHVGFDVSGLPKTPDAMGNATVPDKAEGNYSVDAFELGVNAWATKHVRITGNYVLNYIDGTAPNIKSNLYWQKFEHELLFRLGIAL
jgi:phosphate-selective porin